jgi:hypothetical protein
MKENIVFMNFVAVQNAGLCAEEEAFVWGYLENADMKGEARVTVVAAR